LFSGLGGAGQGGCRDGKICRSNFSLFQTIYSGGGGQRISLHTGFIKYFSTPQRGIQAILNLEMSSLVKIFSLLQEG